MNTLIDYAINATITIGIGGGILFLYMMLRDQYLEYKWKKQWDIENAHWDKVSVEELKRLLDRADD